MKPIIAELIKNAGPDQSLVLSGAFTGVKHFAVYQKGLGKPVNVIPAKLSTTAATITIPANLKREATFVYAVNEAGASNGVVINKAEIWWVQTRIVPGETAAIHGQNLAFTDGQGTSTAYVWLQPATGAAIKCPVVSATFLRIAYTVPLNIVPGQTYKAWCHNGYGGQYGFSETFDVTADKPYQWTGPTIGLDVYKQATDGSDSEAFLRAWTVAKNNNNGTTIQLPGRTLYLADDAEIPGGQNIRVLGTGATTTVIKAKTGYTSGRLLIPIFGIKRVLFEKIGFDGADLVKGDGMTFRNCHTLTFNDCHFNFIEGKPFDINDSVNVYFNRCTITGKQSFIGKASQVFFEGNTFQMTHDCDMALHSFGGKGISLYKNICKDLEGTEVTSGRTWGKGRFFTGAGSWGKNGDFYAGYNTTINLGVRSQGTDPNSGEQFLWESGFCMAAGFAQNISSDGKTFSLADVRSMAGAIALITKGTGQGQWRHVASVTAGKPGTVTVDKEWAVKPDSTSYIVVNYSVYNVGGEGNTCQSKANAADAGFVTANSGWQLYGSAINCIVDNHTNNGTRYGICHFATKHDYAGNPGHEPNFWTQYLNVRSTNNYYSFRNVYEKPATGDSVGSPASFAMIVRGCTSTAPKGKHINNEGRLTEPGVVQFSVWEHNKGFNPASFDTGSGFANCLYYKNNI